MAGNEVGSVRQHGGTPKCDANNSLLFFMHLRGVEKGGRLVGRRRKWKSEGLAIRANQSSGSYFFVEMFSSISRST